MAHCHLRQVGRCGDLSRASQRQGKCKGDFSAHHCSCHSTCPGGRLLRGQWCVLCYTEWNLAHCLWEQRVLSRVLQALHRLHKEWFFLIECNHSVPQLLSMPTGEGQEKINLVLQKIILGLDITLVKQQSRWFVSKSNRPKLGLAKQG